MFSHAISSFVSRIKCLYSKRFDARFLVVLVFTAASYSSHSDSPNTFAQAKKIAGVVFASHPTTLYCHCRFDSAKHIDLVSCGMEQAQTKPRAHRLEWEHMMAAEHFGHHFECWRSPLCERNGKPYKGRACCERIDSNYRHLEAELYNLWPAVGLVNQARSNYRFAVLNGAKEFFGCAISIDSKARRVEPAPEACGVVARAHLFIADQYGIPLSPSQRALFEAWNVLYPPNSWEIEWARRVASIEGYENRFITHRG